MTLTTAQLDRASRAHIDSHWLVSTALVLLDHTLMSHISLPYVSPTVVASGQESIVAHPACAEVPREDLPRLRWHCRESWSIPRPFNQQPAAAAKLSDLLTKLRKNSSGRGKLAAVRSLTSANAATLPANTTVCQPRRT